jgi:cyclopropane fatty-acyl-phospholipid synthase-like methyltransferase
MRAKARKARQPSGDPYSSFGVDDSGGWVGPLPVEDVIRAAIQPGMRVLELGCGIGDVSLWIAKLVGFAGLVVGVDESAERIELAEKRSIIGGQCYWTRFITADLNTLIPHEHTFIPHEGYDAVVVRRAHLLQNERATFLRVSEWLGPDGVILVICGKPAGSTDNRSSV